MTLTATTLLTLALVTGAALAATEDLGHGFAHHGVATPVSNHRGIVCTVDGSGRDVLLVWLFDHTGGYALLLIDAETGKAEQFPVPFPPGGDCPYSSILSSRNRFYTHFNSWFCEFDPVKRAFTFHQQTKPQMAMGMTEDDRGVIWSVTYPNSGVVSFDPATATLHDYGWVYNQNWAQYQRYVAADDTGWIYFGLGNTASQIIAFDPQAGKGMPVLPEEERAKGTGWVYRDLDGKVYGKALWDNEHDWYELYRGQARKLGREHAYQPKPIITSSQGLFHSVFPDGKIARQCDLTERRLVIEDPKAGTTRELHFDYTSEGAHVMGLCTAPDGTICGGTAFPMRFFSYSPKTDLWINRESYGQWNTVARQGDHYLVGGYGGGFLLDWDPAQPWVSTVKGKAGCNPQYLIETEPAINRPHRLLPLPDGHTVVLTGTPQYGYTGGGMLIWDRATGEHTLLEHTSLHPEQSTLALVALPGGKLLGGTTTAAGTGGEKKATEAEMYQLGLAERRIDWRASYFPGAQDYSDLCLAPGGLVYGVVDYHTFFVFDPVKRELVHIEDCAPTLGRTNGQQGPRIFVTSPDGQVYMLFQKGIVRVEPETFELKLLAESPVPIGPGGDWLDGRIYYASGSHVYSYRVAPTATP
ncbi:MAG: hypothetical protein HYU66_12410 [Armatimonadetes bacterium]|nr:hypothetical protein [Armatimonadota bacterium]